MNKKTILIILGVIIIIGLVVAGGRQLTRNDFTVDLSNRSKTQLDSMGLSKPETGDCIPINEDYCEFKIWKNITENETFNLGTHKIRIRNFETNESYSNETIRGLIRNMTRDKLEDYGNVFADRDEIIIPETRIGGGNITTRRRSR